MVHVVDATGKVIPNNAHVFDGRAQEDTLDEKTKARAAALGIKVSSITPELADKWGILISPRQPPGKSKPSTPPKQGRPKPTASRLISPEEVKEHEKHQADLDKLLREVYPHLYES